MHALLRRAIVLEADEVKGLALRFFVTHCAEAMACYARPDERLGWWSAAQECALLEEIARALVRTAVSGSGGRDPLTKTCVMICG